MPSLRHPVGPLPSAIYWRRRFVVAVVVLAVIALVVWLLVSPSGGGGSHNGAAPGAPASSIGPSGGGSNDGASGGHGGGASGSPSAGSSASGGAGSGGASGGSGGGSGGGRVSVSGGASGSGGGSGKSGVPVNTASVMALPACAASDLGLMLDGDRSTYTSGQNPVFRLTVKNTGAADCRIDVGRTAAVVTISSTTEHHVWSSGDCASDKTAQWVEAVAGGSVTVSYDWARLHSAPGCPSETNGFIAGGGTFVAQASLNGVSNRPQWQFRLVAAGS